MSETKNFKTFSEEVGNETINLVKCIMDNGLQAKRTLFVSAPTGKGKSHFIKNLFYDYCKEKGYKILYLLPRKVVKDGFIKELQAENKTDIITVKAYQEFEQLEDLKMHELEKVDFVATEFKSILQAIVSDHNNIYSQTIKELNNNLVSAWHNSGETSLRNFINQHIDSFLAKGQIADFIRKVRPDIANVPQKAKRLTDSIGKQMYDKSNLKELVDELIPALQDYLQS